MTDSKSGQITEQLLRLRAELREQEILFRETTEPVELDQAKVGRLSRMDAMQAQQMALETSRRRQRQLARIDGALHRVESGDYGWCFVCHQEIDVRRLAVDPTSTRCIKCVER